MFTRTPKPERVDPTEIPGVMIFSPDTGLPCIIQPVTLSEEGNCISATETTILSPGYFIPEFTFIPLPLCGHTRCSPVKMGVVLN